MFRRNLALVWIGILCLSSMYLMGQQGWAPQEKIVFLTDGVYQGDLGGVPGAHLICQEEAQLAGFSGAFQAWISDSTSSPATSFVRSTSAPYVLVNGDRIASDWDDLTDGSIENPINITSTGATILAPVWTNTRGDGTTLNTDPMYTCEEWTSRLRIWVSSIGATDMLDTSWTEYMTIVPCDTLAHLYCFQQ